MGTLIGHVFLGPLYSVLGVWYIIQATRRYCRCKLKGGQFVSSIAYTADFFPSCLRNVPIDSLAKLVITVLYIPVELTYSYVTFSGDHMLTKQHSTIAFALLAAAMSEVRLPRSLAINISYPW
ncbi:transmembrane protein 45B [Elysia marginata]|uniref:Transmembrane protein 45B n=1 Tax=Elysia marginata TaxID=1093978 RepID=A0AAV4JBQ6_9GAST|nr:transmembrane protein 45B [Elysia marginata]